MAKKDLSGAAGLDGLFTRGTAPTTEKPKSKPTPVPPKEEPVPPTAEVTEVTAEKSVEPAVASKPAKSSRKSKASRAKSEQAPKAESKKSKSTFTVDISNVRRGRDQIYRHSIKARLIQKIGEY